MFTKVIHCHFGLFVDGGDLKSTLSGKLMFFLIFDGCAFAASAPFRENFEKQGGGVIGGKFSNLKIGREQKTKNVSVFFFSEPVKNV